jgi:hypothetical protein
LLGAVGPAGQLTLTLNGKGVSTLRSGRYRLTVDDRAGTHGFSVQEVRKPAVAVTGASFVGKHTVTVELKTGQWLFYATPAGKKNYFVVRA